MKRTSSDSKPEQPTTSAVSGIPTSQEENTVAPMAHEKPQKRPGKRPGRKPSKIDHGAKLERSRQSARECRARKKLRYQYLEELVSSREKAVFCLRDELDMYKRWCCDLDRGILPEGLLKALAQEELQHTAQGSASHNDSYRALHGDSIDSSLQIISESSSRQNSSSSSSPVSVELVRSPVSSTSTAGQQAPSLTHVRRHHSGQASGSGMGLFAQQHLPGHPSGQLQGQFSEHLPGGSSGRGQFSEHLPGQSVRVGQLPGQLSEQLPGYPSGKTRLSGHASDQLSGQSSGRGYIAGQVVRQPTSQSATLASMHKGSRSFEDASRSLLAQTNVYRSGSVPNLASSSAQSPELMSSGSVSGIFKDQESASLHSTGFSPLLLRLDSDKSSGSNSSGGVTTGNIPTLVTHHSPPSSRDTWTTNWKSSSGVLPAYSKANVSETVGSGSSFAPNLFLTRTVAERSAPFYQRPRSSSDLAGRASSTASATATSSTAQLNHAQTSSAVSSSSSQNAFSAASQEALFSTISDSVATCLSLNTATSLPSVCASGPELSASISEPIPHWYSFLDDLESGSTFTSARRGAFSDSGTPSSSRGRSGPGTPCSVGSPYSQSAQQLTPQQLTPQQMAPQQLTPQQMTSQQPATQQAASSEVGNIPNIISDLLGDGHPS